MKTIKLVILGIALFIAGSVKAQVAVTVNLGLAPMWGPVGYSSARYYYLPDVEAYYDIPSSMFIYQSGGVWVHRTYLPARYSNYDLYHGYKVVMTDYHGTRPYYQHRDYKRKYAKGYHGPAQQNIGDRPGNGNYNGKPHYTDPQGKQRNQGHQQNKGNNSKNGKNQGGHDKGNGKRK